MHFNRIAAVNCDDICAFLMCSWIFPRSDLFPLIYVYFAWKSLFKLGNGNVCWNISITWLATDVCVHLSIVHIIQAQGTHIQTRTCVTSVNKYEQNSCRLIVCACVCVWMLLMLLLLLNISDLGKEKKFDASVIQ